MDSTFTALHSVNFKVLTFHKHLLVLSGDNMDENK